MPVPVPVQVRGPVQAQEPDRVPDQVQVLQPAPPLEPVQEGVPGVPRRAQVRKPAVPERQRRAPRRPDQEPPLQRQRVLLDPGFPRGLPQQARPGRPRRQPGPPPSCSGPGRRATLPGRLRRPPRPRPQRPCRPRAVYSPPGAVRQVQPEIHRWGSGRGRRVRQGQGAAGSWVAHPGTVAPGRGARALQQAGRAG